MTDDLVKRLRDFDPHLHEWEVVDEAADRIEALTAERDSLRDYIDRYSYADIAAEVVRAEKAEADNAQLRATAIQTPDYCYDDEWESTMPWDLRNELVEFADLTTPVPVYTLFKGPTQWAVNIPIDTDGDGEADDFEPAWFDSEAEALAALNTGKDET